MATIASPASRHSPATRSLSQAQKVGETTSFCPGTPRARKVRWAACWASAQYAGWTMPKMPTMRASGLGTTVT